MKKFEPSQDLHVFFVFANSIASVGIGFLFNELFHTFFYKPKGDGSSKISCLWGTKLESIFKIVLLTINTFLFTSVFKKVLS